MKPISLGLGVFFLLAAWGRPALAAGAPAGSGSWLHFLLATLVLGSGVWLVAALVRALKGGGERRERLSADAPPRQRSRRGPGGNRSALRRR